MFRTETTNADDRKVPTAAELRDLVFRTKWSNTPNRI